MTSGEDSETDDVSSQKSSSKMVNTTANNKKRPRSSPNGVNPKDKLTRLDYWLNPPSISSNNRFQLLSETEVLAEETPKSQPKPPPLFVAGVRDVNPLMKVLNDTATNEFYLKVISSEEIKVQAKTIGAYEAIVNELNKRNTEYYSFQKKENKPFKVVLKNLHHSSDTELLKQELEEKGHSVLRVDNICKRGTKTPLPMFYIDLKTDKNNKEIYNIEFLLNTRIKFEAPHKKRETPQCSNCQRFGHTKNFCKRQPRCVKCALPHHTSTCPIKDKTKNVKCVNCEGNHPASYRGCSVYKELQKAKYPPLRKKELPATNAKAPVASVNQGQPDTSRPSYASVLQSRNNTPSGEPIRQSDDLSELKTIMKTLMEQVSTILNLLTSLLANRNV